MLLWELMTAASNKVIPSIPQLTPGELVQQGFAVFFQDVQTNFSRHLARKANALDSSSSLKILQEHLSHTSSYTGRTSYLARACQAAQELRQRYDIGIGIARKGSWLSYVFAMHGWDTRDVLGVRHGTQRSWHPIDPIYSRDVQGKRVLLLENDVVTGRTITDLLRNQLLPRSPAQVDLLTLFANPHILPEDYSLLRSQFQKKPKYLGCDTEGRMVLDTHHLLPKGIGKVMSLERDFEADESSLQQLAQVLQQPVHQPIPPTKVVSLDLDGTVVQRQFDYCLWGEEGYEGILWQMVGKHLGISTRDAYSQSLDALPTVPRGTISIQAWIDHYGLPFSERDVVAAVPEKVKVYPDYPRLRELLQGRRVILATESSGAVLERKLRETGIQEDFDQVYVAESLKSPEFYRSVAMEEGVHPEEIVHIGDSFAKDVISARRAGLRSYFLPTERGKPTSYQRMDCLLTLDEAMEVIV